MSILSKLNISEDFILKWEQYLDNHNCETKDNIKIIENNVQPTP